MAVAQLPEQGVRWFDDLQQEHRWLAQPIGTIRRYADDRGSAYAGLLTSHLLPAAVLAGVAWELLQRLGTWIVMDRLAEAQDLYGSIGFVIVTLFWIKLLARTAVFANEFAVAHRRHLWPRSTHHHASRPRDAPGETGEDADADR